MARKRPAQEPAKHAENTRHRLHPDMIARKWRKGVSGNPAGRPAREVPSETLRSMLAAEFGTDPIKALQKTMPEPWKSKPALTTQEIIAWVLLRRAMLAAGDNARKEVFDRIEGRPTLKIAGPQGGPIETVAYDLTKLSTEKIKAVRALLAEALVAESEQE